jgi:nitroreductase/NAD-dependent dihydropyrimidine dehydrogenase PreA subunit
MTFAFGRTPGPATVEIDANRCTGCGLCTRVCKGGPIQLEAGKAVVVSGSLLDCIACGHCMAVCPRQAVRVTGRDMTPEDAVAMPKNRARFEALEGLMLVRRSVREYLDKDVPQDMIEKIIEAASTAPMGLPPSEVGLLVVAGRHKVEAFRKDLMDAIRASRWMFSPAFLAVLRPFIGRANHQMMRDFIAPAAAEFLRQDAKGQDWLLYDAPLAIYFYPSPYGDPADASIAATYAMLAAESLGLGTCMLGFPGPLIAHSRKLRTKYAIPAKSKTGLTVVFGYPAIQFHQALRRRFAAVHSV